MSREALTDGFYDRIKPRLLQRIGRELHLAGRVLDLGCGSCDLVQYLVRTYHQQVTGVDVSGESFPKRRHTSEGQRFRCIRKNARRLEFVRDDSQDAVVIMWALHEMEHTDAILTEAYRVLRPGGEILIVEFPQGSLAQTFWNEDYYAPDEIKAHLAEARFQGIRVRLIEQDQIIWAKGFRPPAKNISRQKSIHGRQNSHHDDG
jgi:ubiquinone/menaquinone biosynthesis C-methylase UbiE